MTTPGVGPRDLAQRREVAGEPLAHLGDDDAAPSSGALQQRDREAELVVVRLGVRVAAPRREHGREQVLRRGLPGRARRRATTCSSGRSRRKRARDLLQRDERVADVHERASVADAGHAGRSRGRRARPRARVERGRDEVVTVARAAQRDEARAVARAHASRTPTTVGRRTGVADDAARGAARDLARA